MFEEMGKSMLSALGLALARCPKGGHVNAVAAGKQLPATRMKLLHCPPLPLLWSGGPDDGTPASRIHKLYLRGLWRKPLATRIGIALSFLAWPCIVLLTAGVATVLNARQATRRSGHGVGSLLLDQVWLAARFGILPTWYFIYELDRPERRRVAADYLLRYEVKGGLHKLLRLYGGSRGDKTLNDKLICFHACRAAGLSTPAVIVALRNGEATWIAADGRLPDCDLFVKPFKENGGTGAERWLLTRPGRWRNDRGMELGGDALLRHFRHGSRRWPLLVQQRIKNHDDIADLTSGALATVRVLSIWDEDRRPEVTNAAFKMAARPGSIVDNFCAGGLAANVDLGTGRLGPATNFGLSETLHWRDRHPATGAQIEGRQLPLWPDLMAFARKVHETFNTFPVIGLDVAITPSGPCLVEANASSALDLIQRTSGAPLGNSRFGALFARHLEAAEKWRQAAAGDGADHTPEAQPQRIDISNAQPDRPRGPTIRAASAEQAASGLDRHGASDTKAPR